jgi:hypothetical protein
MKQIRGRGKSAPGGFGITIECSKNAHGTLIRPPLVLFRIEAFV